MTGREYMSTESAVVNFSFDHIRDGQRIRSRGTRIKLTVNRTKDGGFLLGAIGDDFQGRGESLKAAILDYLNQSNLLESTDEPTN